MLHPASTFYPWLLPANQFHPLQRPRMQLPRGEIALALPGQSDHLDSQARLVDVLLNCRGEVLDAEAGPQAASESMLALNDKTSITDRSATHRRPGNAVWISTSVHLVKYRSESCVFQERARQCGAYANAQGRRCF